MRLVSLSALLAFLGTSIASGSTLIVDVRDFGHSAEGRVVVYAVPADRKLPLAKRAAVMDQKNRMFVPHVLAVQTGTAVSFPNTDDVHHHVYSFSPAKNFQLPLYKGNPANPIVFDKPGVVALGCNIHDRMSAYIVVVDTPYFGLASRTGRVEIRNLRKGKYNLHLWSPELREQPPPVILTVDGSDRIEIAFPKRK